MWCSGVTHCPWHLHPPYVQWFKYQLLCFPNSQLMHLEEQWKTAKYSSESTWDTGWNSGFLASGWTRSTRFGHLRSEPANKISLFVSPSNSAFQLNKSLFLKNKNSNMLPINFLQLVIRGHFKKLVENKITILFWCKTIQKSKHMRNLQKSSWQNIPRFF